MRMLLTVKFPPEPFNALTRQKKVGEVLRGILEALKPEAAYFTEEHGFRTAVLVIEVADQSKVPFFAEPFFLHFNAECRFRIAMSPEDLEKANLAEIAEKWQ